MSCSTNNSSTLPIGQTGATGSTGSTGDIGANGTTVLFNDTAGHASVNPAVVSLLTHTLVDPTTSVTNSLAATGDSIEIISTFTLSAGTAAIELWIGGALTMTTVANGVVMQGGVSECIFKAIATRISSTSLFIQFDIKYSGGVDFTSLGGQYFHTPVATVNNMTTLASTNVIDIRGAVIGGTLTLINLLILKYKI